MGDWKRDCIRYYDIRILSGMGLIDVGWRSSGGLVGKKFALMFNLTKTENDCN